MIIFKEKQYSECDAMRMLYSELTRYGEDRYNKVDLINKSQLIPVLKGNSVVVEKFVVSTSWFGRDKYRLYIKIGAKASLPDEVRLGGSHYEQEKLGGLNFNMSTGDGGGNNKNDKKNKKNNNNNNNNQRNFSISGSYNYHYDVTVDVRKLLAEAIKYDKNTRELILECDSPQDAVKALKVLPFGLHYKLYLLDN